MNNFFTVWVARLWNRSLREVVGASVLGSVQGQIGQDSEQPDLVKSNLPMAGGWNFMISKVPSYLNHLWIHDYTLFIFTIK